MDIFTRVRRLERTIARTLDSAAQRVVGPADRDPLEIAYAIVEAVEQEVHPAGRGRRVFPFNRVTVHVAVAPEARARYETVLEGEPTLRERIADGLRAAGAEAVDLEVGVVYAAEAGTHWRTPSFHVELERVARAPEAPTPAPPPPPPLELNVRHGAAEQAAYSFALPRIDLGRCVEVRDHRRHLVRTNHVAFADGGGGANETVSRQHAHISYDARERDYRIHDDGSAHGTSIVRNGATIPVRSGSRGLRLRSGDEIALGEARLTVRIGSSEGESGGPS